MLDSVGKSLFWDGMGKIQKPLSFLGTGKNTASSAQIAEKGGRSEERAKSIEERKNLPI